MDRETEMKPKKSGIKRILAVVSTVLAVILLFSVPVFAWFALQRTLAVYAPVAKPESLFIGAGHREFDAVNHVFTDDHFEDIRYLYFYGIDVDTDAEYYDYVFCVFGKMISGYKIQLAYTTNNQFSYEIYRATESQVESAGAVAYETHTETPRTYYYTTSGVALAGSFLNDRTVDGETLADSSYHTRTYGSYSNVDQYGEPLYWQTTNVEPGYLRGDFINYYILRVWVNDKATNDRETDVICIAAKSFTYNP